MSSGIELSASGLGALGRRRAKSLVQAVVPASLLAFRGRQGRGTASPRRIALTFDDGPTDLTIPYLSLLRRFDARATFFVIGELCAARPDLVAEIARDGHELGVHGYTHRRFPTLSVSDLQGELSRTAALLPPTVRRPLVRPPHGALSLRSLVTCARAGFTTALWSYDSGDWATDRAEDVVAAFERSGAADPGAVVLLHEGHAWTLEALPRILQKLREAGHELVTMGELLDG